MNRYIAINPVKEDEFITRYYLLNYINIGRTSENRMNDIPVTNISCLKSCIVYLEEEIEVLRKYHPDAIITPYFGRIEKLNKLMNDLDVLN